MVGECRCAEKTGLVRLAISLEQRFMKVENEQNKMEMTSNAKMMR